MDCKIIMLTLLMEIKKKFLPQLETLIYKFGKNKHTLKILKLENKTKLLTITKISNSMDRFKSTLDTAEEKSNKLKD